ncbi:MAG: ABC transporter substrate-binding protein [Sulfitobacter sp.]
MTRRNSLMDRRALFASGAAAALLAASGVSASGIPRSGGRLRLALSGAARDDTWTTGDGLFMQVARQGLVFDTLTEVAADGTLRAELAAGWQSSDGGRTWIFDLRHDVNFHDGAAFAARDVVRSLAPLFGDSVMVSGLSKHAVSITLNDPNPGLPLLLSQPEFVIRPAHAPASGIGTGLYCVTRFSAGQQLLTERVASHYKDGDAGWFDEVELVSIPSEVVRMQALGEYLVDAVDVADASGLAQLPDITVTPYRRMPATASSRDLAHPAQISHLRPLDNLRAAERWWFA